MKAIGRALRSTCKLFGSQRKLWLPFLLTGIFEACLVGLAWLAPFPPFAKYLAPPIRCFFSDRVLHYPWHMWFLFHVMQYTHLIASTLVGAFLTGIACVMVKQTHDRHPISLREALVSRHVAYGRTVILWLIAWGVASGVMRGLAVTLKGQQLLWSNVAALLVLQMFFIYAIPVATFESVSWWKALIRGVREVLRYPFSTLIVVALPSALAIGFSMLIPSSRVLQLMMRFVPEIAIPLAVLRLVVWIAVDAWMTISIAQLWCVHRAIPRTVLKPARSSSIPTITPAAVEQSHAAV